MKTLKNKIFAGALALASLGFFGEENVSAQVDSLDSIFINNITQPPKGATYYKAIFVSGYKSDKGVVFFECYDKNNDGNYDERIMHQKNPFRFERFRIDFDTGLIDYKMYALNPYNEIANFKNLTKEQIFQDPEFAERTKRIINACDSEEKLREMVKEIYKERVVIKIPNIKQ